MLGWWWRLAMARLGPRLGPSAVLRALQEESAKLAPPSLGAPTPPPSPDGMLADDVQGSWGWSFLIATGFLVLVYCAVGCCRGSAHGRSGLAAMPHADFWRSLPQLVGDGVRFAMGEDISGPTERSITGIAGQDDEYYSADRQDAGEYLPIAGSVSSHLQPSWLLLCLCRTQKCNLTIDARGVWQRRTPGDYGGKGRSQNAANRADRRALRDSRGSGRDEPSNWPDDEDRRPQVARAGAGGDDEDDDEWRNRKTRDTRRQEREERERRVKAWVDSGGADAHWMLSVEDRQADGAGETRDVRRLSMDE